MVTLRPYFCKPTAIENFVENEATRIDDNVSATSIETTQ